MGGTGWRLPDRPVGPCRVCGEDQLAERCPQPQPGKGRCGEVDRGTRELAANANGANPERRPATHEHPHVVTVRRPLVRAGEAYQHTGGAPPSTCSLDAATLMPTTDVSHGSGTRALPPPKHLVPRHTEEQDKLGGRGWGRKGAQQPQTPQCPPSGQASGQERLRRRLPPQSSPTLAAPPRPHTRQPRRR